MNSGPTLRAGMTGPDVRRLQRLFVEMKDVNFEQINGSFDSATKTAVQSFQQSNGLTSDGVVGTQTWSKLPPDPNTPVLAEGASGLTVSALQRGLKSYSAQNTAVDPGPIDGLFGSPTAAAVRLYQTDRGVAVDAVVRIATN